MRSFSGQNEGDYCILVCMCVCVYMLMCIYIHYACMYVCMKLFEVTVHAQDQMYLFVHLCICIICIMYVSMKEVRRGSRKTRNGR